MTEVYAIALAGLLVWFGLLVYVYQQQKDRPDKIPLETPKEEAVRRFEALPAPIDIEDTGLVSVRKGR